MAQVRCRCGEVLEVAEGEERIVCDRCGTRIRLRRSGRAEAPKDDGFVRFPCPCGRRLKVRAINRPKVGRCPDCGRAVPVPDKALAAALADPETRTEELDRDDLALLERWAARHGVAPADVSPFARPRPQAPATPPPSSPPDPEPYAPPQAIQVEAGLRVCPKCGQPLHMNAIACPSCGAYTPKT